jgi:hypothetical protein
MARLDEDMSKERHLGSLGWDLTRRLCKYSSGIFIGRLVVVKLGQMVLCFDFLDIIAIAKCTSTTHLTVYREVMHLLASSFFQQRNPRGLPRYFDEIPPAECQAART